MNSDDLIEKNERLTREKPKDQAYRKIELVDIQKNQLKSLKRQMATHRTNGKTVYVKEEVVEKLEQLTEEGITNVNLADSGIVSLSVAEKALERDKPISRNSSANTLATFMVEKDGKGNKIYRITKDGKYEYKDDKKIVGGDKYHKIFKDGFKPITPKTFYYELSNQSHIDLTDDQIQTFLSLPVDKQVEMIKKGIKKSSDYVQLDELSVNANKTSEDQSTN